LAPAEGLSDFLEDADLLLDMEEDAHGRMS
jgi:hypothetical protein